MQDTFNPFGDKDPLTLEEIILSLQSMRMGDMELKNEIHRLKNTIKNLKKELKIEKSERKNLEEDRKSLTKLEGDFALLQAQKSILAGQLKVSKECQICCERKLNKALSCGHSFCSPCAMRFFESEKCPTCLQKPLGIQCLFLN